MVLISRCSSVCLYLLCFLFVNMNTMTVFGGKNCCYFCCLIFESLFLMLLKICCSGRGEVWPPGANCSASTHPSWPHFWAMQGLQHFIWKYFPWSFDCLIGFIGRAGSPMLICKASSLLFCLFICLLNSSRNNVAWVCAESYVDYQSKAKLGF